MAGDIWEQAVETYLALDRGMFLNPEYLVGTPNLWESYADFLALDFPNRRVWMVEVTKAPRTGLFAKINAFNEEYAPKIREQLQRLNVISGDDPDGWTIGLWVFAPGTTVASLKNRLQTAGVQMADVTALEDTLAPSAWEHRFR